MNILKNLRRPYFAMFLASLMLFVSCNQDSLIENPEVKTQTLDEYLIKHFELTSKMIELKSSVDYNIIDKLKKLQNKAIKKSDLKIAIKDENIEISDEIFELQQQIIENTKILYNNPKYNSLNQEEFLTLITNEINSQLQNKQIFSKKSDSCLDTFNSANESCLKSFGASLATVGVVGLFTSFGVGSLIGGGIALIRFGECNKSAQADLADCRDNQ
ncbi:hypothetical protein [Ichthyenterobacterium magnum]|uniref:Uncharacterized protein n=1 Tax=Ichthyenterobacterium magnum TaxID=1230530 RepID=A0A420DK99_9FLAO|nr:hypothetical protein [Ichthyenterobacterium magnum]RKE94652.1 hypothetical protein BXY80_1660 [Ichthyenterobacterium magnum]